VLNSLRVPGPLLFGVGIKMAVMVGNYRVDTLYEVNEVNKVYDVGLHI
jgi:hypothetical protein